jgi:hypothetical protein
MSPTPPAALYESVTVGPVPIFFCNQNAAMGLKPHCHTAAVYVVYATLDRHGYPSFKSTNDDLRLRIRELTGVQRPFRDATNEDVARRLFAHLDHWVAPSWREWGGVYELDAVHLDVEGVEDLIGHDAGVTRYTVARAR